jgi:hypothetical protein
MAIELPERLADGELALRRARWAAAALAALLSLGL